MRSLLLKCTVVFLFLLDHFFVIAQKKDDKMLAALKVIAANKGFEQMLVRSLGADAPLRLDQNIALPQYIDPVNDFKPVMLRSVSDLDRPLAAGDYSVDVIFYCTQWSIHQPGRGLPYKLGRAQGRLSKQMTALLFRGTLKHISPGTLNAMAWRIQGGVTLKNWSPAQQKMVHELIPEYEKDLGGDYVQQFEGYYNKLVAPLTKKAFDAQMTTLGDLGKTVLSLKKSRQVLANKAIADDRLPQLLYDQNNDGTPLKLPDEKNNPSPWITLQPGVIGRFTVQQGNLGHNLLEFRVLRHSDEEVNGMGSAIVETAEETAEGITLNKLFNGTGNDSGKGLIGYSMLKPAQAPEIQPNLDTAKTNAPDTSKNKCYQNFAKIQKALQEARSVLQKRITQLEKQHPDAKTMQDMTKWFGSATADVRQMIYKRMRFEIILLDYLDASSFKDGQGQPNTPCDIASTIMCVHPHDTKTHTVYICDHFCALANPNDLNSALGAIIHEMSHFTDVGNTCDEPFGDANTPGDCACLQLALDCPAAAQRNAYNFEYFVADVRTNCPAGIVPRFDCSKIHLCK